MKDLLGNTIAVGDHVVVARTGYRALALATVVKITPLGIKVNLPHAYRAGELSETYRGLGMFVKASQP